MPKLPIRHATRMRIDIFHPEALTLLLEPHCKTDTGPAFGVVFIYPKIGGWPDRTVSRFWTGVFAVLNLVSVVWNRVFRFSMWFFWFWTRFYRLWLWFFWFESGFLRFQLWLYWFWDSVFWSLNWNKVGFAWGFGVSKWVFAVLNLVSVVWNRVFRFPMSV